MGIAVLKTGQSLLAMRGIHASHPSTQEADGSLGALGQPVVHSGFWDSQDYIESPKQTTSTTKTRNQSVC